MAQRTSTGRSRRQRSTTAQGSKTAKRTASQASSQAQKVASTAAGKGQEVANIASEQASDVVATAREQAAVVTGEATRQAQRLIEETKTRVQGEVQTQTEEIATRLRGLGQEAKALADGRKPQGDTVQGYLRQAGNKVTDIADQLDARGIEGLVSDAQDFARRRPTAFLVGAGVAGFLASRVVRGAGANGANGSSSTTRSR